MAACMHFKTSSHIFGFRINYIQTFYNFNCSTESSNHFPQVLKNGIVATSLFSVEEVCFCQFGLQALQEVAAFHLQHF